MILGFHQSSASGAWPVAVGCDGLGPGAIQAKTHAQKWIPISYPTKPFSVSQFPASMLNIAI